MRLTETTFDNFRCFKDYKIRYGMQTTIFIGKNGTGKSSILSGIRRGLSFMFARPKTYKKNLATSNNAKVQSFNKLEANFDPISRSYNYPIENRFNAFFNGQAIKWSLVKNNINGGLITTRYSEAMNSVLKLYNDDLKSELPVLAVITDSFPHQLANFGSRVKKTLGQDILPRDLGYYGWDERTNCTELWLNRLYKVSNFEKDLKDEIDELEQQITLYKARINDKDHNETNKVRQWEEKIEDLTKNLSYLRKDERLTNFSKEREFIHKKLLDFTEPLSKEYDFINRELELFRIAVNRPDKKNYTLEFSFKDGRVIAFETLPMGYKRIFSIILDIAYRSYILNENVESIGIVLIDEIELHLHPTFQQEILQRLKRTFPNIQFIITTHSPLIISNFKADKDNILIKLEHDGNDYFNEELENVYGLDYSTNLSEIMEVAPRSSTIDKFINAHLFLYRKGKLEEANELLSKLKDYVGGTLPELLQQEIDEQKKHNK